MEKFQELHLKISTPDLESFILETEIKGTDNNRIAIEVNATLIHMSKRPYVLSIARDITESQKASKALEESERRYRTIFDNSSIGFGFSKSGPLTPPTSFLDCNERLASFAGMPKEELISSMDISNRIILEDLAWKRYYKENLTGNENISRYSWVRPDGKKNHIVCESKTLMLDDEEYVLSFHRDVTARVKADEKIKELSRQMGLAVEHEKKRIALDLHDELGQQLHGMRYLVDRMHESFSTDKTDKPTIPGMVLDLGSLIDKLGTTCRDITFQLSPARLDSLDIRDIVCDLVEFIRDHFPDKSIHSEISSNWNGIDSYSKMVVFRIIQEAINNIIEHSKADNILISILEDPENRILKIKDNGIGFTPDLNSSQKNGNGKMRGYGLLGMHERINSLDGEINFYKSDEGTTLEVKLPRESTV